MMADYTDYSPEIKVWLEKFKNQGVPLTVIISASSPSKPIRLTGSFSQGEMTEALNKVANQSPPAQPDTKTAQIEPPQQTL
jgi:thiol:disulfide interchange protein